MYPLVSDDHEATIVNSQPQVLVVDDEWTIRQQLSRALALVGISSECASDGDEALRCYLRSRHPVIVTDLRMPQKNGHSLAVSLLDQPSPPVVIALTGVTDARLSDDLLKRGVREVMFKPVNFFQVAREVKCLVDAAISESNVSANSVKTTPIPSSATSLVPIDRREIEAEIAKQSVGHRWIVAALQWIDWERFPNPPCDISDALRQLSSTPSHIGPDGRCTGRAVLSEKAIIVALDDNLDPIGEPLKAIIRDLSMFGIGIVTPEYVTSEMIAVTWRGVQRNKLVLLGKVLRCRPVGAFFDVGAMITARPVAASDSKLIPGT